MSEIISQGDGKVFRYTVYDNDGKTFLPTPDVEAGTYTWTLSATVGGVAVVTKTTASGKIVVINGKVEVTLDPTDTTNFSGLHIAELVGSWSGIPLTIALEEIFIRPSTPK